MRIETERLLLRGAEEKDADRVLALRNSEYVMKYNAMEPLSRERVVKDLEKDARSEKALYLELKETGELIGTVWLAEDSLRYGVNALMLEYYLGEEYAGKGYMTEALKASVRYAFGELGAELVSARVFRANQGSARVLEKLGFIHEGTVRRCVKGWGGIVYDDMLFSLLREEYEAGAGDLPPL